MIHKIGLIVLLFTYGCTQSDGQQQVEAEIFKNKLEASDQPLLIDVRSSGEFESGHLKNAINFNVNDHAFGDSLKSLDNSKPLFLYCGSGIRSAKAATVARELGFTEIYDLKGGIAVWQQKEYLIEAAE